MLQLFPIIARLVHLAASAIHATNRDETDHETWRRDRLLIPYSII